jgi:hypothetical protein
MLNKLKTFMYKLVINRLLLIISNDSTKITPEYLEAKDFEKFKENDLGVYYREKYIKEREQLIVKFTDNYKHVFFYYGEGFQWINGFNSVKWFNLFHKLIQIN